MYVYMHGIYNYCALTRSLLLTGVSFRIVFADVMNACACRSKCLATVLATTMVPCLHGAIALLECYRKMNAAYLGCVKEALRTDTVLESVDT